MTASPSPGRRFEERFVGFDCVGDGCLGVLAMPAEPHPPSVGVVVIVGGPQTRVGSHRQFVLLARNLAAAGFPTLRFDYRGMGDSNGDMRTFEDIGEDLTAAVDALQRESGVSRVVLWGLCDGASAAWMSGGLDTRVAGIVALNPWARSARGEAATRLQHYYLRRLLAPDFWQKTLGGGLQLRKRVGEMASAVQSAARPESLGDGIEYLRRMESGWRDFSGPTLIILSGNDFTAREFEVWVRTSAARKGLLSRVNCMVSRLPGADHTFSNRAMRERVTRLTIDWLKLRTHAQLRCS